MTFKKMTILQILPSLDVGGAERATVDVAAALAAAGHRALVISSGGPMVEQVVRSGAAHIAYDIGSKNPWVMWKNRQHLIDLVKAERIDLVHARSRAPAWSALLATRALEVPFVTTFHDAYRSNNAVKKFYNSVMSRGDRVIAISRFVADHIRTQYPAAQERIVLIQRGIDFSVFNRAEITVERVEKFRSIHQAPQNIPVLVMPARLSPAKGHELTLLALSRIGGRSFHCLIVGPDKGHVAYRARLLALTRRLNLQDKVRFIERADMPVAYASADLVLSPSQKQEGFGRVPVEAQAMGVPVIATALGATVETVLDGETGWLVPAGDVQALADAIALALSLSSEQRRIMAGKAIRHARANFDVNRMCAATLDLYAELLSSRRAPR